MFYVQPDAGLGSGPHDGKTVEYLLTLNGKQLRSEIAEFGTPLDTEVENPAYSPVGIQVRWPWAEAERLRNFQEPYFHFPYR